MTHIGHYLCTHLWNMVKANMLMGIFTQTEWKAFGRL